MNAVEMVWRCAARQGNVDHVIVPGQNRAAEIGETRGVLAPSDHGVEGHLDDGIVWAGDE